MFVFLIAGANALAQTAFPDVSTKMSITYTDYTGERLHSFAGGTTASGFLLQSGLGNRFLEVNGGMGFQALSGQETILDGTTERTLDLSGYVVHTELGLKLFLIPHQKFSWRPYVGATGVVEFITLKLPDNITYTNLSVAETSQVSGSALAVGFDFLPNRAGGKVGGVFFEVRSNNIGGKLLGDSAFKLQGLTFLVGLQF